MESRNGWTSYWTIWCSKIYLLIQIWLKSDYSDSRTDDYVAYMAHTVKFYENPVRMRTTVSSTKKPILIMHNQWRSWGSWGWGSGITARGGRVQDRVKWATKRTLSIKIILATPIFKLFGKTTGNPVNNCDCVCVCICIIYCIQIDPYILNTTTGFRISQINVNILYRMCKIYK